ncbi:hypothetical protein AMD27_08130 [Acinetobacter sp. TGL-Y2]|nr:hypothetical protein AMD27_08130 [Acinetobacter sp. TGL-Y2]
MSAEVWINKQQKLYANISEKFSPQLVIADELIPSFTKSSSMVIWTICQENESEAQENSESNPTYGLD